MKAQTAQDTAPAVDRIERIIGTVLQIGVVISTASLLAGSVVSLAGWTGPGGILLNLGVVVLLATPMSRVIVSVIEYVLQRDWAFVVLTLIVLGELTASAAAALFLKK